MQEKKNRIILVVLFVGYIVFFGTFTALRHYSFQTQTWDLAVFEQTFWNTIQGRFMQNNLEETPYHLGVHMRPFMMFLVPGFAFFQSPYYLLIVQTIALALGAIPLYFLAQRVLKSSHLALLFATAYLFYPSLHWVNWYDFHEIAFFPSLMLAAFYFLEVRRFGLAWVFLILAASVKEDAIIAVAVVGLWLFLKKRAPECEGTAPASRVSPEPHNFWTADRRHGTALILGMALYFLVATKFIMPALGGGLLRLDRYTLLGGSVGEITSNLIRHPSLFIETIATASKAAYVLWIFLPIAFLPLFAVREFVLLVPGLLENLLTSFTFQFSSLYQYDAILIAAVFCAAVYGLQHVRARWPSREKAVITILMVAIAVAFFARSPASPRAFPIELFRENKTWDAYRTLVRAVPQRVSVAAPTNLVPHLSNREHAYMLGSEPFPVDVVIIDAADSFGFKNDKAFQKYADSYALSGEYAISSINDRYFMFIRKTLLPPELNYGITEKEMNS